MLASADRVDEAAGDEVAFVIEKHRVNQAFVVFFSSQLLLRASLRVCPF